MQTFCAFDLETTGLSAKTDKIIEIGAVRFDRQGQVIDRLDLLVNPGVEIPWPSRKLTGIREDHVRYARNPQQAVALFKAFCEGDQLVGHDCQFDLRFLAAVDSAFASRSLLDTHDIAKVMLPQQPNFKLESLASAYGIRHVRPHRAWSDAAATAGLFRKLVDLAEELPSQQLAAMRQIVSGKNAGLQMFFSQVITRDLPPAGRRRRLSSLRLITARWRRVPEGAKPSAPPRSRPRPARKLHL